MYTYNHMYANIDSKLYKMSKIQVLIIILHEGARKHIHGGFIEFKRKCISYILIKAIVRKVGWVSI